MHTQENTPNTPRPSRPSERESFGVNGRAMGGVIVIIVGSLLLIDRIGYDLPDWVLSWPMIPIAVGFYIGARHNFRHWFWLIPVAVGTVFLSGHIMHEHSYDRLFWPVIIIVVGLGMIFRSRFKPNDNWDRWKDKYRNAPTGIENSDADYMEVVTVFGGAKKVVISKDFKGGEAVTIFGGAELNFIQADIQGRVPIELVQVFGGAKLVIPADWRIHTDEMVCIFGGIDDKRNPATLTNDTDKVLVLKGTCIFGGIDIKSF